MRVSLRHPCTLALAAWLSAGAHACLPWMHAVTFQSPITSASLEPVSDALLGVGGGLLISPLVSIRARAVSSVLSDPELCLLSPQSTPSPCLPYTWLFLSSAGLALPGLVHLAIPPAQVPFLNYLQPRPLLAL